MKFLFIIIGLLTTFSSISSANGSTKLFIDYKVTSVNAYVIKAKQKSFITAKQAARIAKRQYGGKVLKVKRNGKTYRVKLLKKSGHIIWVRIDAMTGNVL